MAKALADEAATLGEREVQVVGGFEIVCMEVECMPLHLMVASQESQSGQVLGYVL